MIKPVTWLEALNWDNSPVLLIALKSFTYGELMKGFAQKPLLNFDTHLGLLETVTVGLI